VSVTGTLFEAKMCTFTLESTHFIFNRCPFYKHDGSRAKFSFCGVEKDYSVSTQAFPMVTKRKFLNNLVNHLKVEKFVRCRRKKLGKDLPKALKVDFILVGQATKYL
jgi:hypothetical protein